MDKEGGGLWTEAVLLIAIIECGSMNRAADRLGVPQHTISRRVKRLEDQLGYPLFQRQPSGVTPTPICLELMPAAQAVADAARGFTRAAGMLGRPSPVTLSAPEGLAAYFLAPALAAVAMPPLQLVHGGDADIEILLVELGQPVCRPAAMCVKRVGRMPFVAVAGKSYLATAGEPRTISDLAARRRLTHMIYDAHPAFAEWTDAVRTPADGPALTVSTSSALHRAAAAAGGIALLPRFAPQLDSDMVAVDCGLPEIAVDVYMAAHPDLLRLPSVRQVFDGVGALFAVTPWFS